MLSVLTTIYIDKHYDLFIHPYRWISDSNTLLALLTGVCPFMFFKDLHIKYNPLINKIGACTFGVLLIHASSDTMRQWLWKDFLDNVGYFSSNYFILHAVLSVVVIFIVCVIIDYLRQRTIEKWMFVYIDKLLQKHNLK